MWPRDRPDLGIADAAAAAGGGGASHASSSRVAGRRSKGPKTTALGVLFSSLVDSEAVGSYGASKLPPSS